MNKNQGKLRVIPLGGLGEIGANCMVLEWGGELVIIDCGVQFPDASFPGVGYFIPDLSYVTQRLKGLKGVVITHGHEDHIGAVPFLLQHRDLDIYATPFPTGLIQKKMDEFSGLKESRFHKVAAGKSFKLGPFTFHPISVQHSIIEALGFAIETPAGVIIHSGDFKEDSNEYKKQKIGFGEFAEWGKKGVKILFSDSTNAERHGHTLKEDDIAPSFEKLFSAQKSRIIIALFASNIRRVENLFKIAAKLGKKVVLDGRSMHSYTRLAFEQGSLEIPTDTLIPVEKATEYPKDKILFMVTGSQAEAQSSLTKISQGIHRDITLQSGDTILLSSRFIPGNERNINRMINDLCRAGAEVIYSGLEAIHTSGHGFRGELKMMIEASQPEYFFPIHGEYRHLVAHSRLAKECGIRQSHIVEDGQVLEVDAKSLSFGEKLSVQKIAVVNGALLEKNHEAFQQRHGMAKAGIVFVGVTRDKRTLDLIGNPCLLSYGLLYRAGFEAETVIEEAIEDLKQVYEIHRDNPEIADKLRIEVRRFLKSRVSYKPIVIPSVIDL